VLPDDAEDRLAAWLAADLGTAISGLEVTRLDGGHSSGTWRLDVTSDPPVGRSSSRRRSSRAPSTAATPPGRATRFMVQLGLPTSSVDAGNPVVSAWEACVAAA
jgi:hypothetical protein